VTVILINAFGLQLLGSVDLLEIKELVKDLSIVAYAEGHMHRLNAMTEVP